MLPAVRGGSQCQCQCQISEILPAQCIPSRPIDIRERSAGNDIVAFVVPFGAPRPPLQFRLDLGILNLAI